MYFSAAVFHSPAEPYQWADQARNGIKPFSCCDTPGGTRQSQSCAPVDYWLFFDDKRSDIAQLLETAPGAGSMLHAPIGKPSLTVLYGLTMALFVYGWLSVNIYLPILPELETRLHTTSQLASLTVTVFLIGFSFAQLVWGPMSDRYGRRPVLLVGLATSTVGAMFSGLSPDIGVFMAARFLESVGMGVGPVLARSVLTDSLDKPHVAIAMAYVAIVVAVIPAIAPVFGGYINLLVSWRGIFFFLALVGICLLAVGAMRLPETLAEKNPDLTASRVLGEYMELLGNRRYLGYICAYAIAFGTTIGYYAAAPYIFIRLLGYSPHEYGYLLFFNALCYVLGATAARLLVPGQGSDRVIQMAILVFITASFLTIALDFYTHISTASVLVPMSIFIFGSGLVSPAANAGAMTIFRDRAGASTAVIGFSIAIGGAIFSGALSAHHIVNLGELGPYLGVSTLASIALYLVLLHRRRAGGVAKE
jgi:DHA1 family bicyclomycin/chloramphenicol resistance-like MFS transporter